MSKQQLIITLSECLALKDIPTESQPRVHNGPIVDNFLHKKLVKTLEFF